MTEPRKLVNFDKTLLGLDTGTAVLLDAAKVM